MTDRELREIKRRFRPDKNNIPTIVGCFVNENKEIISRISQPIGLSDSVACEKLLTVMKRTLSGSLGTNLTDISFSSKQVLESEEHALLMKLRETRLKDDDALLSFYKRVIECTDIESNYVILLASDIYDVFDRKSDGDAGESNHTFSYIISAICPIKSTPENLYFKESDSLFHAISRGGMLTSPELGFMFPAFDDRRTNIYGALYYSKSIGNNHPDFVQRIFASQPKMPPKAQKAVFCECLTETLAEECDLSLVRTIHSEISDIVESHKDTKVEEPLTLSKAKISTVLENCGVGSETIEKFSEKFDESFGKNAEIAPKNIVECKKYELATPDVTIKVNPERRELITTEIINGVKYILIRAEEGVTVNGINIKIN